MTLLLAGDIGGTKTLLRLVRAEPAVRRYLGLALFSQAGVAVGLAVNGDGIHAEFTAGADNPEGYFTPVGDKYPVNFHFSCSSS